MLACRGPAGGRDPAPGVVRHLPSAGARPKGQVHHHHHQRVGTFAKAQQDRPATARARQWMIFQHPRMQARQHTIAVLGEMAEVAIELLIPIGKRAQLGQVFHLVDVARANAAAVGFLQGD